MRVAIVHYWLVGMRGGERVVDALCELFPDADLFTHVVDRKRVSPRILDRNITTTFIDKLPAARKAYPRYLPLMPLALEQLDLRGYDLVISSESGPAKGVITDPDALHICYCHTPMRYIWELYHEYTGRFGPISRAVAGIAAHYLRMWDVTSAARVDRFVANSEYVARRIHRYYGREATVIYPPVETPPWDGTTDHDDYYLMVGQLVRYKRTELAVEAFNEMGKPLVIVGDGERLRAVRRRAGPTVKVVGWQPDEAVQEYLKHCRALVFPGLEDFGMVPVEAMAAGRPVIGYGRGGVAETVRDGETGVLFSDQTVEALVDAVARFETVEGEMDGAAMAAHASRYDRRHFLTSMRALMEELLEENTREAR